MISANELRIGNWLQFVLDGKFVLFQVTAYSFPSIETGEANHWEPIPLTHEILNNAGFEDWGEKDYCKGMFHLQSEDNGYMLFGSEWTLGKPFYYVHQLQNLYFALMQEELEIKF